MAVILLDDGVEKLAEGGVGIRGTSVAANTGVDILAAREDALLEGDTGLVALVVVGLPDVLSEELADEGFGASGELGPACDILRLLKVWTGSGTAGSGIRDTGRRVATHSES